MVDAEETTIASQAGKSASLPVAEKVSHTYVKHSYSEILSLIFSVYIVKDKRMYKEIVEEDLRKNKLILFFKIILIEKFAFFWLIPKETPKKTKNPKPLKPPEYIENRPPIFLS